jgi:hypothetical protein
MSSITERRSGKRVAARLPVKVRPARGGPEQTADTRDLSAHGVFLYTNSRLAEGTEIEMMLILPEELSGKKSWVCCHATVVRVEEEAGARFGVAAAIRKMEVLPEIGL